MSSTLVAADVREAGENDFALQRNDELDLQHCEAIFRLVEELLDVPLARRQHSDGKAVHNLQQ